jgi:hypothetical protein
MDAKGNNKNGTASSQDSPWHHRLALIIIVSSMVLIFLIVLSIFITAQDKSAATQTVLNSILPLIGAWVGAVIAFYFSGKNLEKATDSIQKLIGQMTPQQKLQSIPVKDKMIPKDKIFFKTLPETSINLLKVLQELDAANKGKRIPVFDDKGRAKYIIHRSLIDRYLTDKCVDPKRVTPKDLTLQNLIDDSPKLKSLIETSFGTITPEATLADAKKIMDLMPNCQDVFVTKNGTKEEEVIGWITNVIIADNSVV